MLSGEEFLQWCARLSLSPEAQAVVVHDSICRSHPAGRRRARECQRPLSEPKNGGDHPV